MIELSTAAAGSVHGPTKNKVCSCSTNMAVISVEDQEGLFKDVEAAFAIYSPVRSSEWRGSGSRGGPSVTGPTTTPGPRATAASGATGSEEEQSISSTTGEASYWAALSSLTTSDVAADVQRWMVTYVKGLSLDEIEMMAARPDNK